MSMRGRSNNQPDFVVRQLNADGELVPVGPTQSLDDGQRLLFVDRPPQQLLQLEAPVLASQIANKLFRPEYTPNVEQLRLDIETLRAQLPPDPGGSLQRDEIVKFSGFPCATTGEIQCAYSIIVMRSVYNSDIIAAAGIIVKEALIEGICELHNSMLRSIVRDAEFNSPIAPLCLCIAPGTQLTIDSDVMNNHLLALQETCPLDHYKHQNYSATRIPGGLQEVDSLAAQQTGISLQNTCWTKIQRVAAPAEGALSDHNIELSVYLDKNDPSSGAGLTYTATFRVTRWQGDSSDTGPCMIVENTGSQPVFMGLLPRRERV